MAVDKWGDLELNVMEYTRKAASTTLKERQLLPAYDAHVTKVSNTVIQGVGRRRKTREIEGWATRADYLLIQDDYKTGITRTVIFDDDFTMVACLWDINSNEQLGYEIVWYQAVFKEAGD